MQKKNFFHLLKTFVMTKLVSEKDYTIQNI